MNEINAAKRLREAASEKAEAEKIMQVKAAVRTQEGGRRLPHSLGLRGVVASRGGLLTLPPDVHISTCVLLHCHAWQEASAEAKYLNGLGIARERKAIVEGLRDSVEQFSESVDGASAAGQSAVSVSVSDFVSVFVCFGAAAPGPGLACLDQLNQSIAPRACVSFVHRYQTTTHHRGLRRADAAAEHGDAQGRAYRPTDTRHTPHRSIDDRICLAY